NNSVVPCVQSAFVRRAQSAREAHAAFQSGPCRGLYTFAMVTSGQPWIGQSMHQASSHARRTYGTSFAAASVQQLSQKATRSSSHNVLAEDSTWCAASKLQLNPVTAASRSSNSWGAPQSTSTC